MTDFHQLLTLLCPDFPRLVIETAAHLLPRSLFIDGKLHFKHVSSAFFTYWLHTDSFIELDRLYRGRPRDGSLPDSKAKAGNSGAASISMDELGAHMHPLAKMPAKAGSFPLDWAAAEAALHAAGFDSEVRVNSCLLCAWHPVALATAASWLRRVFGAFFVVSSAPS